jgi:hypothetical protein
MAISKDLTTPVDLGTISSLGAHTLAVNCHFDAVTGQFVLASITLEVREGEFTGSGPYEFEMKKFGLISKIAADIPAAIQADLEALIDKGLVLYAQQEGYDVS